MGDFKKNERDLKEELSPISYAVTQENATERPFSGKYDDFYEKGIYVDIVSGEPFCLAQPKNTMRDVAGRRSVNQSLEKILKKRPTFLMVCTEWKCEAVKQILI